MIKNRIKSEKSVRWKKLIIVSLIFVGTGLVYTAAVSLLHAGIPCFFHMITGLECPGCGMTRAAADIIHIDFEGALKANAFAPVIFIFFLLTYISTSANYIRKGVFRLSIFHPVFEYAFLILFLAWGIIRNLF